MASHANPSLSSFNQLNSLFKSNPYLAKHEGVIPIEQVLASLDKRGIRIGAYYLKTMARNGYTNDELMFASNVKAIAMITNYHHHGFLGIIRSSLNPSDSSDQSRNRVYTYQHPSKRKWA